MIEPVEGKVLPLQNISELKPCSSKSIHLYRDTLVSGKKRQLFQFNKAIELLKRMLSWIKYNLLSWFFGTENEKKKKLEEELEVFIDKKYYPEAYEPTPNGKKTIRKCFRKLDKKLQALIKEEIIKIIKAKYSNRSEKSHKKYFQKVMNDPFFLIKKSEADLGTQVMGDASLKARVNLSESQRS